MVSLKAEDEEEEEQEDDEEEEQEEEEGGCEVTSTHKSIFSPQTENSVEVIWYTISYYIKYLVFSVSVNSSLNEL